MEHNKINRTEIITFYVLACALSWPLFAWRDLYNESWTSSGIPTAIRNLGVMWGPGLAAIICFFIFRKTHVRTITFGGTSAIKSLIFYFTPYIIWFALSIINPAADQNPEFFLALIPFGFLMTLGEELGWRGFLQDTLRKLPEWKKWLTIGLMWEFWHFTRGLTNGETHQIILRKSFFIVATIILTIIIGKLTDRTKSLLVAITLHSWVNIQMEFPHVNTHIAAGISVVIWTFMIWKWNPAPRLEKQPVMAAVWDGEGNNKS